MIRNVLITGDTHGRVTQRILNIARNYPDFVPEETAIIILGDVGINYYLNKSDKKNKYQINKYGYKIYCVRGNHEEHPGNIDSMEYVFDEDVGYWVYWEEDYPNIRYLADGFIYNFKGYRCLVIGGAYSVDKWWRLQQAAAQGSSFSGWFEDEQLTPEEMKNIFERIKNENVDFVFTHTCPSIYEPKDLFLSCVDQSTVDKSMEYWLNDVKNSVNWKIWCFGHFHADRVEYPCVEQFYYQYEEIDKIYNRWYNEKTISQEYKELELSPSAELWSKIKFENAKFEIIDFEEGNDEDKA